MTLRRTTTAEGYEKSAPAGLLRNDKTRLGDRVLGARGVPRGGSRVADTPPLRPSMCRRRSGLLTPPADICLVEETDATPAMSGIHVRPVRRSLDVACGVQW